jgi:hypothetical protein
MAKKQEGAAVAAPSKKSAKKAEPKATKKAAKTKAVEAPAKKSKKEAEPKSGLRGTRKNVKHEPVADETVLASFDKVPTGLLTKAELVAACGGDESSVTKTVNRLRGQGKIVVQGSTRSAVYRKAA